jgi:hypothetical protein
MWSWKRKLAVVALAVVTIGIVAAWLTLPEMPEIPPPELTGSDDFVILGSTGALTAENDPLDEEILQRFDEIPLTDRALQIGLIYRLILLPTFDPPILVQVRLDPTGPHLKEKPLDGLGGYGPEKLGSLAENKGRPLTEDEWNHLTVLVEQSSFWSSPSRVDETLVNDGATWAFYGRNLGMYHVMFRTLPDPKSEALFRYMLRLAGHEERYRGYFLWLNAMEPAQCDGKSLAIAAWISTRYIQEGEFGGTRIGRSWWIFDWFTVPRRSRREQLTQLHRDRNGSLVTGVKDFVSKGENPVSKSGKPRN